MSHAATNWAILLLWRHGQFGTLDIAELRGLESQVALALHAARGTMRMREAMQ